MQKKKNICLKIVFQILSVVFMLRALYVLNYLQMLEGNQRPTFFGWSIFEEANQRGIFKGVAFRLCAVLESCQTTEHWILRSMVRMEKGDKDTGKGGKMYDFISSSKTNKRDQ